MKLAKANKFKNMAIDYGYGESREEVLKENYLRLKEHISSKDESGKLNEFFWAHTYLCMMEEKLEKQSKQIKEYEKFFSMLNNFLPKGFLINDAIK